MNRPSRLLRSLLLGLVLAPAVPADAGPTRVVVFAAASLAEPFGELARVFEAAHPGTIVRASYLGSQILAAQLAQGAPADVFAAADERSLETARAAGRIAGQPAVFARNQLCVIVPRANPARIARLQDLARHGVKLDLGADNVPVGRYGRQCLAHLAQQPGFGADFARRALANVVSEEENVKAVVGKVRLGEADAGIVYRSDVTRAVARHVTVLAIPGEANVVAAYPIATVTPPASSARLAQAFVDLVRSPQGQGVLAAHGFLPARP